MNFLYSLMAIWFAFFVLEVVSFHKVSISNKLGELPGVLLALITFIQMFVAVGLIFCPFVGDSNFLFKWWLFAGYLVGSGIISLLTHKWQDDPWTPFSIGSGAIIGIFLALFYLGKLGINL